MARGKLRVGAFVKVWWLTGRPNNMAVILEVKPYTGAFPQHYDCVLRLEAPRTWRGWLEMAYRRSDFAFESEET